MWDLIYKPVDNKSFFAVSHKGCTWLAWVSDVCPRCFLAIPGDVRKKRTFFNTLMILP
jgi:hypothetical protein